MEAEGKLLEINAPVEYMIINGQDELDRCCEAWSSKPFIALDTEFMRVSSFYPRVGLVQVCDGEDSYLLDPLTIEDWSSFKALMLNTDVAKVLHSCSEDLLVFLYFLGAMPQPIFDTQIANAFLNEGFALSYQNLVAEKMDIALPKGETRSDWLQRPLSPEQLMYAALDVVYLPDIYLEQKERLESMGRLNWLIDECARLPRQYQNEISGDFSASYLNVKSAWQLDRRQLAGLRELARWREERARERDKPRNWIVDDKKLMAIARALPDNRHALSVIEGITPNFVRFESEPVIAMMKTVIAMPEDELPEMQPRPLTNGEKGKIKAAQRFVEEKAKLLSLPVELLASKRILTALYRELNREVVAADHPQAEINEEQLNLPEELRGWRKPLLLPDLIGVLK